MSTQDKSGQDVDARINPGTTQISVRDGRNRDCRLDAPTLPAGNGSKDRHMETVSTPDCTNVEQFFPVEPDFVRSLHFKQHLESKKTSSSGIKMGQTLRALPRSRGARHHFFPKSSLLRTFTVISSLGVCTNSQHLHAVKRDTESGSVFGVPTRTRELWVITSFSNT